MQLFADLTLGRICGLDAWEDLGARWALLWAYTDSRTSNSSPPKINWITSLERKKIHERSINLSPNYKFVTEPKNKYMTSLSYKTGSLWVLKTVLTSVLSDLTVESAWDPCGPYMLAPRSSLPSSPILLLSARLKTSKGWRVVGRGAWWPVPGNAAA